MTKDLTSKFDMIAHQFRQEDLSNPQVAKEVANEGKTYRNSPVDISYSSFDFGEKTREGILPQSHSPPSSSYSSVMEETTGREVFTNHFPPSYFSGFQRFMRKWGKWYQKWINEKYLTREDISREGVWTGEET